MPEKPKDIYLASELIREYLMNLKLDNTTSVFCEELGQPDQMIVDREFIAGELGLNAVGSNEKIPLLVLIIQYLVRNKEEMLNDFNLSVINNDSNDGK
jgi:hypothetical protein